MRKPSLQRCAAPSKSLEILIVAEAAGGTTISAGNQSGLLPGGTLASRAMAAAQRQSTAMVSVRAFAAACSECSPSWPTYLLQFV